MISFRVMKQLRLLQHASHLSGKNIYPFSRRCKWHQSFSRKTLIYRFCEFFEEDNKYDRYLIGNVNSNDLPWEAEAFSKSECEILDMLKSVKLLDIQHLIISLKDKNFRSHVNDSKKLIRCVDEFCCERIGSISLEDTLRLNHSWLKLLGFSLTRLHFFSLSLEHLKTALLDPCLSPRAIIFLTLFYASFQTEDHNAMQIINIALKQLCRKEIMEEMLTMELVLVTNVAFKSSTKIIYPSFMCHLADIINKDSGTLISDPAIFVSFIKTFRHNKYHDYILLEKLEKYFSTKKNLSQYNFTAQVHLLALYADALYGKREFLSYLINVVTKTMLRSGSYMPHEDKSKNSPASRVRVKDLARLLWASSYLGFKINSEMVDKFIIPMILDKAQRGQYDMKLELLVESVLSLWMMGFKPSELITYVISKDVISSLSKNKHVRYNLRLQLLIACVNIEAPEIIKDISAENWITPTWSNTKEKRTVKPSTDLLNVLFVAKSIAWKFGFVDVKCKVTIPYLNLPSIVLKDNDCQNKSILLVEVLDESNCLHKTDIPNGLMLLKLRLLRKLGHQVILVNYREYRNDQSCLIKFLEDEINQNKQENLSS